MQIAGSGSTGIGARPAVALAVDTSVVVTELTSEQEALALPAGSVVGDLHGGLTFTDAVAAALEARSLNGWQEVQNSSGQIWTVIVLDR